MVLQLCGRVCRCLFLETLHGNMKGFLFYNGFGYSELKFAYLTATGSPPFNFKCRGSRLTIPNREVKPDCADGTAVMWESMCFASSPCGLGSLPFFRILIIYLMGTFLFMVIGELKFAYLKPTGLPPLNIKFFF